MKKISAISILISSIIIIISLSFGVGAKEYYHNHLYTVQNIEADCLNNGYSIYTCECGESYTEEKTKAVGHNYSIIIKEATCQDIGYYVYTCNNCGYQYEDNYVGKSEHNFSDWETLIMPSETENGTEVRTCNCGEKEFREYICEHINYSDIIIEEATCESLGKINSVCNVCGKTISEREVSRAEHKFGNWETISYASPDKYGTQTRSCSCGETEIKNIPFEMAGKNSIYIVSTGINVNYVVSDFTSDAVDTYDVVCNYTRIGNNNPAIFGHNTGSMKKLYNTEINSYIYFSVDGVIDTYIVRYSEKAIDVENGTELQGLNTGYKLFHSKEGQTLRLFTCYNDKEYGNIRWIVMAEKIS